MFAANFKQGHNSFLDDIHRIAEPDYLPTKGKFVLVINEEIWVDQFIFKRICSVFDFKPLEL